MLTFFMESTYNDTDFIKRFNYDLFTRQRFATPSKTEGYTPNIKVVPPSNPASVPVSKPGSPTKPEDSRKKKPPHKMGSDLSFHLKKNPAGDEERYFDPSKEATLGEDIDWLEG